MGGGLVGGIITLLVLGIVIPRLTKGTNDRARQQRADGNARWWNQPVFSAGDMDGHTGRKVTLGLLIFAVTVLFLEAYVHPGLGWLFIGGEFLLVVGMFSLRFLWSKHP